jgi:hypothetical protein
MQLLGFIKQSHMFGLGCSPLGLRDWAFFFFFFFFFPNVILWVTAIGKSQNIEHELRSKLG